MSRGQTEEAVRAGADAIIAQGGEAGGNGGWVATMVLVPQVVDVAGDRPVLAAGGIADGRGLAAALALGARACRWGHASWRRRRCRSRAPGRSGSSPPTRSMRSRWRTARG